MHQLDWIAEVGWRFVPTVLVVIVVVAVMLAVNVMLSRRRLAALSASQFSRQVTLLMLGNVGVVFIVLTLPVAEELRRQLLALLGLVLSAAVAISSASFVGNAMAGLMLRAVRNFHPGDFVAVGEHFGRVTERGLFHVEIQTEDRDLTTIPNLFMVTHPVRVVESSGTILSATVSLGYDLSRSRIEKLLLQAVEKAGLSEGFVWITELGDFSVTYRAAGFLADVKALLGSRSRLRACILDALHGDGVEIVSPAFMNQRQLEAGRRFIPSRAEPEAAPATAAAKPEPEKVIFDKAEQAEALEALEREYKELEKKLESIEKSEATEAERGSIERRLKRLSELLEAARTKKDNNA